MIWVDVGLLLMLVACSAAAGALGMLYVLGKQPADTPGLGHMGGADMSAPPAPANESMRIYVRVKGDTPWQHVEVGRLRGTLTRSEMTFVANDTEAKAIREQG